ncbi:MAG: tRNA pseudouridine(55) synthase TruB [Sphingomonadales bacterium]|nr:tRNA pseudouridine(55) synthase TruB [Sphingomonadales bacterium]
MSSEPRPPGEILLINKPYGWTSFQVVKKIKWVSRAKRVGHAGTLDPLATGMLLVCTEGSTRKIQELQDQEKEYTGTITLGSTTPSYDLETEPNAFFPIDHITEIMIKEKTAAFTGVISQQPPVFSAIKVDGKRAYKLAREGVATEMKSREITIKEFEITGIALPDVHFRVVCSKGTYIRSLAHDFAKALGSGGHLSALCRTRIGEHRLANAVSPKDFEEARKSSIEK